MINGEVTAVQQPLALPFPGLDTAVDTGVIIPFHDTLPTPAGAPARRIHIPAQLQDGRNRQRFGDAEEVATVALFLSTDDASYLTGTMIPVDGGWTAT